MKFIIIGLIFFLLIGGFLFIDKYSIPQLIPEDYNCDEHPGFISKSNPTPLESSQHYINRKSKAIQKQIEEVCGNGKS